MPQVTPLGVKLGSQVCGGTPHAWLQRISLPRMGHENTEIQAFVEPSSPHTWLHNFTPDGVSHTKGYVADYFKTIFA